MPSQRFIPNKDSIGLYKSFINAESCSTDAFLDSNTYLLRVQQNEVEIETYLLDVFNKLGISASVKTKRYSLPYVNEILNTQNRVGLNYHSFDLQQFVSQVIAELFILNVKKLRFYIIGDLIIEKEKSEFKSTNSINGKFRYTIHEKFDD